MFPAAVVIFGNLSAAAAEMQNSEVLWQEVEIALREIRIAAKSSMKNPDCRALYCAPGDTVNILR